MTQGDGASPPADEPATKKSGNGCLIGCLAVVVVPVLVFAGIMIAMLVSDDGVPSPEVERMSAQNVCEDAVRGALKAPSTAEFTGTTASGSGPWQVTGAVDSQNSFGAMIRSEFGCTVTDQGETLRAVVDYIR